MNSLNYNLSKMESIDSAQLAQDRFGLRVAARLSVGNTDLPHDISERLRVARQQAIARRPKSSVTARQTAPSIAMSSSFGNVVMLGIPLALGTFGDAAAAPMAVLVSLHTPLLFATATLHQLVVDEQRRGSIATLVQDLVLELVRNPIILGILAGTAWRLTGLGLHPVIDRVLVILAQSSVATSLVGLGLSLVGFQIKGQVPTLGMILCLKLVLMPITAWLLAVQVFALPPVAAGVIILFAAMPTGANAYIFAASNGRAVNSASGAVALGSLLALLTATIVVYSVGMR